MRFGFVHNPTNPDALAALDRARAWCSERDIAFWESAAEDQAQIGEQCRGTDVVCVLGGDGTFLRSAQAIGDSGVPALGVNLGRVGFLAKVETDDLEHALQQVVDGDFSIEDRLRIAATVIRGDGNRETHACLNEVVMARGHRVRMIQVTVEVSGSHLATYVADGVVVATPTGSTAYSFSAGGAILDPRLRNMIITPVAAYLTSIHSVVAGEEHTVTLQLRHAPNDAIVSFDGHGDLPLASGDRIEVTALPEPFRLLEPTGATPFYDLLRTKASRLPY